MKIQNAQHRIKAKETNELRLFKSKYTNELRINKGKIKLSKRKRSPIKGP